jgi:hypothetical protein
MYDKTFFRIAAIAAGLTSLTTFLLWLLPKLYTAPVSFEEGLSLASNPFYTSRLWVNFIHIPLALLGYYALYYKLKNRAPMKVGMGFLWFGIWGAIEMVGVAIIIFAVNKNWRASYPTLDESSKILVRGSIDNFLAIWDSMFFVLLIAFLLASTFYAWATWSGKGIEKILSYLLWLSVPLTILIILSGYFNFPAAGMIVAWTYPILQPVSRFMLALVLWKND